jgi:hypothetical protein
MKHHRHSIVIAGLLLAVLVPFVAAAPSGTAFTYQGRLLQSGVPGEAAVDLRFQLFDAETEGTAVGAPIEATDIVPSGGLFSVPLDFGPLPFLGEAVWIEASVREAGTGDYTVLSPRQRLRPTPYALHADRVAVDSIDEAALQSGAVTSSRIATGAVGASQIDSSQVQRRIGSGCAAGSAIQSVGADGSTTCATLDDQDWLLQTGSDLVSTTRKVSIGTAGFRGAKTLVWSNSAISQPHIEAAEAAQDFARISLTTIGNAPDLHGNFWTLAGLTQPAGADPALDRFNLFNNRYGDLFSVLGDGRVSVGGSQPSAPLTVYSDGQYFPGSGNGRGDLYIGDGSVGLSFGVALGGGGFGASRIWTKGGVEQLFLGSDSQGDVLALSEGRVGVANTNPGASLDVAGDVRVRPLADAAATRLRSVAVDADGDLALAGSELRRLVVPATEFLPYLPGVSWNHSLGAGSYAQQIGSTAQALASVQELPDGARIESMTAWIRDVSSDRDLQVCLRQIQFEGAFANWVHCVASSGDTSATTFESFTAALPEVRTVDAGYGFVQLYVLSTNAGTTTTATWEANTALRAVVIEFRMP